MPPAKEIRMARPARCSSLSALPGAALLLLTSVFAFLPAASVILWMAAGLSACGEKGKQGAAVSRPVVREVEVIVVRPVPRETTAEALGTVRANTTATVAPQVMGRLTGVAVSEGSVVAAGALLATIDDTTVRAQLASAEGAVAEAEAAGEEADRVIAQAEAAGAFAEKTYERFRKLVEGKLVAQREFDEADTRRTLAVKDLERARQRKGQAVAKLAQARGQADAARAAVAWTKVTAPFAGVVVEKRADAGSMAVPGVPLFLLEDPRRYRIESSVSEAYLPLFKKGTRVQVILDADPGKPFSAAVTEIVPAIDPASRTFTVKADLPAGRVRSGQSGKVRFAAGKGTVLAVPKRAITRAGGSDGVFTVGALDNVARLSMITLGAEFDDRVEVLSGLAGGARVAVSPIDKLSDGARVEVRR
jgi:RND family efflux transporter MFP subunit